MLTSLNIQGLAIIDQLTIDFDEGFNVITGETGAGKSILIKALGLLFGAKAKADVVRQGYKNASVTGAFVLAYEHRSRTVLEQYGFEFEDGEDFEVLMRRTVSAKGRSQAWINDVPVTQSTLREMAGVLIDVFGQHDNQKLLDAGRHTRYVDAFLKDKSLLGAVADAHTRVTAQLKSLREMCEQYRDRSSDLDYLTFRHQELVDFDPSQTDFDETKALVEQVEHKVAIQEGLNSAQQLIDQGYQGEPLGQAVWQAVKALEKLPDNGKSWTSVAEQGRRIASELDDFSYVLGKASSGSDLDEAAVDQAEERLGTYQELIRKYRVDSAAQLAEEREALSRNIAFLQDAEGEVTGILNAIQLGLDDYSKAAAKLATARKKAAAKVEKDIYGELADLAMPGAQFQVRFVPWEAAVRSIDVELFGSGASSLWAGIAERLRDFSESGQHRAQFFLSANPGEPAKPLHLVASGGEVSRIMLAMKKVLTADADTCVLVFDEIDSGISGQVADKVGYKLATLAQEFQVICISHLPQVAVYSEGHYLVEKQKAGARTISQIIRLDGENSQREIARLLSGGEVTKASLANAKNLIRRAREKIN